MVPNIGRECDRVEHGGMESVWRSGLYMKKGHVFIVDRKHKL